MRACRIHLRHHREIGDLIARETTFELGTHIGIGMGHGLTADEIEEVILHAMRYAGIPSAFHATVVREVLQKLGHLDAAGIGRRWRGCLSRRGAFIIDARESRSW